MEVALPAFGGRLRVKFPISASACWAHHRSLRACDPSKLRHSAEKDFTRASCLWAPLKLKFDEYENLQNSPILKILIAYNRKSFTQNPPANTKPFNIPADQQTVPERAKNLILENIDWNIENFNSPPPLWSWSESFYFIRIVRKHCSSVEIALPRRNQLRVIGERSVCRGAKNNVISPNMWPTGREHRAPKSLNPIIKPLRGLGRENIRIEPKSNNEHRKTLKKKNHLSPTNLRAR